MSRFPLLNILHKRSKNPVSNVRLQLELLKQSTKNMIAVHNETVLVLWDVTEQLKQFQRDLLCLEKSSAHAHNLKRDIIELTARQKMLDDALHRHRTANLIHEKLTEIQRLELKLAEC